MNLLPMRFVAEFAELLTTALTHFVWQGAVLTLMLLVLVKMLDVRTARLRYQLSVGTLVMMGMAPILTIALHLNFTSLPRHSPMDVSAQPNLIVEGRSNVAIEEHSPIITTVGVDLAQPAISTMPRSPNIQILVLIVWLAGVLILSTRLAIGFGVTLWIRANVKPLSEQFEQRVRILGDRLRVVARNRVFTCVNVGQAVAVGFIRPVVLIPVAWLTQLTPEMLEAVIAHELAHIRRWDLWVNLVQRVIETLLFYHPAVWWLSRRIRLEREMCCDEIAAACFDRAMYARSLESVARIAHGNLLMAASINGGKKMNLLSRIRYLLGIAPTETGGNWWAVAFVATILPFAATLAFSLTAGTMPSVAMANDQIDEAKAAREIERLGGDVVRDKKLPGKPVTKIWFQSADQTFNYKHMHLFKAFKHLEDLELRDVEITDESLKELKDLKTLRSLNLSIYTKDLGPANPGITDAGLKELKGLIHLKSLAFWQARITDEGLKELRDLKNLTELNLTATKITDAGLKELRVLKNLNKLTLHYNNITDAGLKELKGLQNLTELRLGSTKITDAGLKELMDLKKLTSLDVQQTQITGTGLKDLGESSTLTELCMIGCPLTNDGSKEIEKLKHLTTLNLDNCPVTDDSLTELGKLKSLKLLLLNQTQISKAGIKELKKSLPRARIAYGDPSPAPADVSPDSPETDVPPFVATPSVSTTDGNLDESKAGKKHSPSQSPNGFEGEKAGDRKELAGIAFRWCPAGKFSMGEYPGAVSVSLSNGFWIGETEITQGQWQSIVGTTPWKGGDVIEGTDYAASYINFDDAVSFCEKLTSQERASGQLPKNWKYSLPTEAQWEYACRAGAKKDARYFFGDDTSLLGNYAWFNQNASDLKEYYAHRVGLKQPNAWGLKDTYGNVCEWASDRYGNTLSGGRDPQGPSTGSLRVIRGGGWGDDRLSIRSAFRLQVPPADRHSFFGFRVTIIPE